MLMPMLSARSEMALIRAARLRLPNASLLCGRMAREIRNKVGGSVEHW